MNKQTSIFKSAGSYIRLVVVVMVLLFVLYLGFLFIWRSTSVEYLPSNRLDSEVKTPAGSKEWFERRKNGN